MTDLPMKTPTDITMRRMIAGHIIIFDDGSIYTAAALIAITVSAAVIMAADDLKT